MNSSPVPEGGDLSPETRQQIVDDLVRHVHEGSTPPGNLDAFKEWLLVDGWDELIAGWQDACAIKSLDVARSFFNDNDLADRLDIEDLGDIDDVSRVSFAKTILEETLADDGDAAPSIHPYGLRSSAGQIAVMGVTMESHGQAGPTPVWHGFFRDEEAFLDYLRQTGYWLSAELGKLEDERILALWTRPKRRGASRRKK
jgi:hypothetical protein